MENQKTELIPGLNKNQFILLAIKNLCRPPAEGIHNVWSSFNLAFRKYFPNESPVQAVKDAEKLGIIRTRPTKGGYMLYPSSRNTLELSNEDKAISALKKMGLIKE